MRKVLLFASALLFATLSTWAQTIITLPGNSLSGSFGAWGGTGYFYSPKFNVNATGGIDITYYDIDVSQFTEGNVWTLKGVALPGVSASNSMTSIDPNNNSVWCNILNMEVASGTDWDGHALSTVGTDGICGTADDTRHQGTQDWYRKSTGGKIRFPAAGPYYNNESYVIPNPRHPSAPAKTASELNSYDFRLRILPTGTNSYTCEMWFRMHNSAATVEGAYWVFNKAMNNTAPADAWRAFTANPNGTGTTVFPVSNIDLSSVYVFMGLGNYAVAASQTLTWGNIVVTGTPTATPTIVWVDDNYSSGGANDDHTWGYDAFTTVQGGINAVKVGGTVNVAVGTYCENVTINKQVFLQGNVGSIIDGTGLGGNGFLIKASGIRIKNFEIKNYQIGIRTFGGPSNFETLQIQKCNIHNNTQNGILIVNDIFTSVMIKSTQIYSNGQNGIGISNGASITSLSIVESSSSNNGQHGMFIANANLTNVQIEDSNFNNATSNRFCGITFSTTKSTIGSFRMTGGNLSGNKGGGLYVAQAATTFVSLSLDGVNIKNNQESGMLLGGGGSAGDLRVENCTFQGNAWEDVDLSGGWFGAFSVTGTASFHNNFFNDGAWSKIWIGSAGTFGNINVNSNSFAAGAWRIYNENAKIVNATCNWWGSITPVGNTVTSNVIKVPYLADGTDGSIDVGFQPTESCTGTCGEVAIITGTNVNCKGAAEGTTTDDVTIYLGYGVQTVTLSASSDAAISYLWSTSETTQDINVSPETSTPYSVTVTYSNGCTATDNITVKVIDIRCGNNKVTVCHNGKPNCISVNAVPAHLAHGDCLGSCLKSGVLDPDNSFAAIPAFKVYPNPSHGIVNVEFTLDEETRAIITLVDMTGKTIQSVFNNYVEAGEDYRLQIDTYNLTNGIYMVKMITDAGFSKIIKLIIN